MRRVTGPLARMGARFIERGATGFRSPVRGGELRPLCYEMPVSSAQIKSCLLLAGMVGGVEVALREPHGRSRDHTERMLRAFGYRVAEQDGWLRFQPAARSCPSISRFRETRLRRRSWSAPPCWPRPASFAITGVGLNPTRTGFLQVLRRMGARSGCEELETRVGEPVGDLIVRPVGAARNRGHRRGDPRADRRDPLLAILASRAEGTTVFREVGELRVKESDRLGLIAENLRAVGGGPRWWATTSTSTGGEAPPRARSGPPAITASRWPSRCWARSLAPGSGSTTWPAPR